MKNLLVYSALTPAVKKENTQKPTVKARYNIREINDGILLELSIPGYDKSEVTLSLDKNILTVHGAKHEVAQNNVKIIRKDFSMHTFKNVFTIDDNLDTEYITATVSHGILNINIPHKPSKAPQSIEVK